MKNVRVLTLSRQFALVMTIGLLSLQPMAQFSMSGEIRPRAEYLHGFKTLAASNQDHAFFVDQRTRLNFEYRAEDFETFIQVQDIRTWGSSSQLNRSDGFQSIHQAWGKLKFNDKFNMKLGRQEIILDDHRIFGSVAWAQQARSHDALIFGYKDSTVTAQLGGAYNQNGPQLNTTFYSVPKNYKAIQYLWLNKVFSKKLDVSVLFLNNGIQATKSDTSGNVVGWKDNYSQTFGTSARFGSGKLTGRASFYYQMGVHGDWSNTEIAAMNGRLDLLYKASDKFSIEGGYEYLSGTSQIDIANKKLNSFNPFYGTNHKFNGYMDYFYVGNHAGSVGLQDGFLGFAFKKEKYVVKLIGHYFLAAADVMDVAEFASTGTYKAMSPGLGQEVDLVFGYKLAKGVMLQGGYSQMLGTETMVAIKGGSTSEISNWSWMMLTFKPNFYESKK